MKSNNDRISQFAASAQHRLIVTGIINHVARFICILSVIASVLNVLFVFLPFSFIIYLFDTVIVLTVIVSVFICIYHLCIKRVSKLEALRYLEKKSRLDHAIVSIAYEMRNDNQSVFTKRTSDTAVLQIQTLSAFFPSYSTVPMSIFFSIGIVLFLGTSLLQNSAIHHMSILGVFTNKTVNYIVNPGTITIPKGKNVVLTMESSNSTAQSCWLLIKDISSGKTDRKLITRNSMNLFTDSLINVTKSIQYQYMTANRKINDDSIFVVYPPVIQSIALTVINPEYMHRTDPVMITGSGNASVYRGATIGVEIESSILDSAGIVMHDDTISMKIQKRKAIASFKVESKESISYSVILHDTIGQKNEQQIRYDITILPDELPVVQIVAPAFSKNLTTEMSEKIAFEAFDDFGISRADLQYFISRDPLKVFSVNVSPNKNTEKYQKEYLWDLSQTGMYPGDTLFYFVKVTDNYPYKPSHSVSSDTFFFRIPSFEEISKGIHEKEMHAEQLLKKAVDNAAEIRRTADKIQSESKHNSENPSWEQIQLLDEMKVQVDSQRDSLQKAIDELGKSADELRKQGELGTELAAKMEQIEKMLEKLAAKYGDSLFTTIDANKKLSSKQLQEAVQKAKELLPDLENALDNTLKYLEAMEKDRELAELAMKAEYLARQQIGINEQDSGKSSIQQERVVKESAELNSDIRKTLDKNRNDNVDSLLERIDSLGNELNTRNRNQAAMGNKVQTAMSQSLMSLSEELRQMMSDAQMVKAEKELKMILGIAGMLLNVTDWIEELGKKQRDDKTVGEHLQVFSDAMRKVQSSIDKLEQIPPEMLSYMTKQVTAIIDEFRRITNEFESFQVKRLDTVSTSLLVVANDLMSFASQASQQQNSCNSSRGGGMMSKMRKLSQRQSGVNAATSAMLRALMESKQGTQPGSSGNSFGTRQQIEAARKEAMARQKEIADELAEIQKEFANENVNAQIVKRLEELKKEAQRLTEMLVEPSPILEEKQNEFLNRMLQSTLSINKRDEEKEDRTSESAKTIFSEKRGAKIQVPSTPDAFYLMKRKALQGNFPESYRNAINSYLDSLGVLYLKEK